MFSSVFVTKLEMLLKLELTISQDWDLQWHGDDRLS